MHPLHEKFAPARRIMADQLGAAPARFLLERMAARELRPGSDLLTLGAPSDALYYVLGGTLGVYVGDADRPLRVGRIGPGEWVGEVTFVDPGPASATVRAEEEALVVELRNRDIAFLTDEAPDVVTVLLHRLSLALAERLVKLGEGTIRSGDDGLELASTEARRSWWPFGARR